MGGHTLGTVTEDTRRGLRRFDCHFDLELPDGTRRSRRTGHYVARHDVEVDESYYRGEDYVDYETQSEGSTDLVLDLVTRFGCRGPVLEVGCATGATLEALRARGLDGVGVDFSEWAVSRARQRLGDDSVAVLDLEHAGLPESIATRGPFGCLVMASVFEHFSSPFDVLARLTPHIAPGGHLLITTTNADSLTHRIFGNDWEGFFDWTHHGIQGVTPSALRERVPPLGWNILDLHTWHVWDGNADPTRATLREWHDADARFRQLLAERELGDFLVCVATRTS
jgi:2-polyprenyl-3-methyl-5-hydroxy-6-metoxy-1,4-benzoquinol methylase